MLLLRKIFFYLFVLVYLVLCPLVILYAFGFILKPGTKQEIVETGLIHLSSAPPGATVYLKNSRYTQKTPATIQDLLPGDYPVTLNLKDYKPWSQAVSVEAGEATAFDKILLIPLDWKKIRLSADAFKELMPVSGEYFFLLAKGAKIRDIYVYDWQDQKTWPLVPPTFPLRDAKVLFQLAVKKSPVFLLYISGKNDEKILWVEPKKQKLEIEDITDLFPEKPLQVKWDPDDTKHLFSLQEDYLNLLDIGSGAIYPKYVEDVRGYGLFNKQIYVLKKDNTLLRMNYDKSGKEVLLDDPALGSTIFGEKGTFKVKPLTKEIILFLGEKGQLLANRLPYRFVESGVLGSQFHSKNMRLLFWQKNKIGILDFLTEETGNVEFEKGPELKWFYTGGNDIRQCFWVYEGSHILLRDKDDIFLIEPEPQGEPHLDHIVKVKKDCPILYLEETGSLYYLDRSTGNLCAVEVVPKK